VAVAVLGIGRRARRILSVSVGALWVVLVRNVLSKVWRHHLANVFGLLFVQVLCVVAVGVVSCALRQALVVVAVHQGGVVVRRGSRSVVGGHCGHRLDPPGGSPSF
jgi:hypothetical protein